jgi:hypothetical protein
MTEANHSGHGCWYFVTEFYCPQCGHSDEYRERRYTTKPSDHLRRREIIEAWDYCGAL